MDDDAPSLGELIENAVGEAIENAVGQHERGMALKWITLVESIDTDGDRGLWTMTSADIKAWDTVGMLQHALHLQQAQTFAARLNGDDDDADPL